MNRKHSCTILLMAVACACFSAMDDGGDSSVELTVTIPRLNVAEYHRPYVAIWIQDQKRNVVANLSVWYQIEGPTEGFGEKWLADLRQWWRRSGRSLTMPVDGLSGATRPAGEHMLQFDKDKLASLSPGEYTLIVEAAREVGGRELIEIPFSWPAKKAQTYEAKGEKELGDIKLTVNP